MSIEEARAFLEAVKLNPSLGIQEPVKMHKALEVLNKFIFKAPQK